MISIAAGLRLADLSRWLGGHDKLVRTMPNTPALIGAGVTGLFALPAVSEAERLGAERVLQAVGSTLWIARRGADGRRDRRFRQRPGLRLPVHRSLATSCSRAWFHARTGASAVDRNRAGRRPAGRSSPTSRPASCASA